MKIESKVHAHTVTTLHVVDSEVVAGAEVDDTDGVALVKLSVWRQGILNEAREGVEFTLTAEELEELYLVVVQLRGIVRGRP